MKLEKSVQLNAILLLFYHKKYAFDKVFVDLFFDISAVQNNKHHIIS